MNICPIKKDLQIFQTDHQIFVTVEFFNISENIVYVQKDFPNLYITYHEQEVEYIGVLDKRKALKIEDYEKVFPRTKTVRQHEISALYRFVPGEHEYLASIAGGYKDPISKDLYDAPRIAVTFKYKAQ